MKNIVTSLSLIAFMSCRVKPVEPVYTELKSLRYTDSTGFTEIPDNIASKRELPKIYNYSDSLHCDDIISGMLYDPNLYKIIDGKLHMIKFNDKYVCYGVDVSTGTSYLVSSEMMEKIRETIKREKCKGIKIRKYHETNYIKWEQKK